MAKGKSKETKKTQSQLDKEQRISEIRNELQTMCDSGKYEYMSEVMKAWNSKGKEKIQDCVKQGTTITFHLGANFSASCVTDKIFFG